MHIRVIYSHRFEMVLFVYMLQYSISCFSDPNSESLNYVILVVLGVGQTRSYSSLISYT